MPDTAISSAAASATADAAGRALGMLAERVPDAAGALAAAPAALQAQAHAVFGASDFVLEACLRDAALLPQLLAAGGAGLAAPMPWPAALLAAAARPEDPASEAVLHAQLRLWRHAEQARIAWLDLAGHASLPAVLAALSQAAERGIALAHDFHFRALAARHGAPFADDPASQPLVVIGMGKLGGGELNFSSDVDLIFLHGGAGETTGAQPLAHEEFYTRLGQRLIRALDAPLAEGRAWRVDMRLRPFGASGPLVASVAALEDYLEAQGRDWERYAWIKARALTGGALYERTRAACVQPFVYRRYLDFGVIESLREMKAMIGREVQRRELQDHVKLGPGGIREIEFIVQSLQLIRGGQERRLQGASLLTVLPRLAGARLLPEQAVRELGSAYEFLRRLENRLQMYADQQVHVLPAGDAHRARIAASMGCADWEELHARLDVQRERVAAHFAALIQADAGGGRAAMAAGAAGSHPGGLAGGAPIDAAAPLRLGVDSTAPLLEAELHARGFADAAELAAPLAQFAGLALLRRLDDVGRRRLEALLGALLGDLLALPAGATPAAATATDGAPAEGERTARLRRLLRVCEAVGARSAYYALLLESPRARARLVALAGHGEFLLGQIAAHPLLLDELLDGEVLERPPARAELAAELDARLSECDPADEERLVEQLRHFQRAAVFRIAVADLSGHLPLMQVSDRLTEVAELILAAAMALSWRFVTAQYGTPRCGAGDARRDVRVCAVGYGKLGGMELGYGSDLDLVFLHDSEGEAQETEGARSVDNQVFFVRYVQRLVHLMTMHSAAGRLYEVDMRLRPSGKGGMLVTGIAAFEEYQRREAWTWEHQALLHARGVAGDATLRARFEALRLALLRECVRRDTLREEVRRMRERMRAELAKSGPGQFDLKQDPGGVADIEFLAQYWGLRWSGDHPPVAWFADTIRVLESLASADLVPQADIDRLVAAYRHYRARTHRLSIEGRPAIVEAGEFVPERAAVTALWRQAMEDRTGL
jgi:glutamate-ammonia-ligase adenylyltransferase